METSLEKYLNTSVAGRNRRITISQGPLFRTRGGYLIAFVFLFFALISIITLIQLELVVLCICLPIAITLFYLMADIRGIQVDTHLHKIREYKLFLGFRLGKWANIKDFGSIYVTPKNVTVRQGLIGNGSETFHYYHIKLVDEADHREIFLAEYKNYYKALKIAAGIANATGLILKDFLKGGRKER